MCDVYVYVRTCMYTHSVYTDTHTNETLYHTIHSTFRGHGHNCYGLVLIRAAAGREDQPTGAANLVCSIAFIRANTVTCIQTCKSIVTPTNHYTTLATYIHTHHLPWSQLTRFVFGRAAADWEEQPAGAACIRANTHVHTIIVYKRASVYTITPTNHYRVHSLRGRSLLVRFVFDPQLAGKWIQRRTLEF